MVWAGLLHRSPLSVYSTKLQDNLEVMTVGFSTAIMATAHRALPQGSSFLLYMVNQSFDSYGQDSGRERSDAVPLGSGAVSEGGIH